MALTINHLIHYHCTGCGVIEYFNIDDEKDYLGWEIYSDTHMLCKKCCAERREEEIKALKKRYSAHEEGDK